MPADKPETAVPLIVDLLKTRIPRSSGPNSIREIRVLCQMIRVGVGTRLLNIELQPRRTRPASGKSSVSIAHSRLTTE
jgi:exodeoxyribonuclease V alpha subunit